MYLIFIYNLTIREAVELKISYFYAGVYYKYTYLIYLKSKYFSDIFQRDPEMEKQALDWIEAILGEPLNRSISYEDLLKDGIVLCKYVRVTEY